MKFNVFTLTVAKLTAGSTQIYWRIRYLIAFLSQHQTNAL